MNILAVDTAGTNVHKVVVRDANGNRLTDEQVSDFLEGNDRSLYRKWIPDNSRATGLFVYEKTLLMLHLALTHK